MLLASASRWLPPMHDHAAVHAEDCCAAVGQGSCGVACWHFASSITLNLALASLLFVSHEGTLSAVQGCVSPLQHDLRCCAHIMCAAELHRLVPCLRAACQQDHAVETCLDQSVAYDRASACLITPLFTGPRLENFSSVSCSLKS